MGNIECKSCEYLVTASSISLISQMMGYSAECKKCGALFKLDDIEDRPLWCPLIENYEKNEKLTRLDSEE